MIELKNLIQDNIVNPTAVTRGQIIHGLAQVTHAYEKKNYCTIKYIDKDGMISNREKVMVKIYNPGGDSWFPKKNDIVTIEDIEGNPMIVGKAEEYYETDYRTENENENDIYSDEGDIF